MRAFVAQRYNLLTHLPVNEDRFKCAVVGAKLSFLDISWPISEIELREYNGDLLLTCGHDTLITKQWKCLNALMPYLSTEQREQANTLQNELSSASGSRLVLVLLITIAVIGGLIALIFLGQIQLRQQQLAVTSDEIAKSLGEKHLYALKKAERRCTSPEWDVPLTRVLRYYQNLTGSKGIQQLYIIGTRQPQSLMLSDGTLAISTGMLRDLDFSALLALMAHQEGHLQGRHRLGARIYEQGNQVFKRLWQKSQQVSDRDYLLKAPLWVQYSRGQEAAVDQWSLEHLKGNQQGHLKSLAKVWSAYIQSSAKLPRFMERHPLATDRLQQIDQLPDAPAVPEIMLQTMKLLHQQSGYCTQN